MKNYIVYKELKKYRFPCADQVGGGGTGGPDPPEKSQKYRVSYNTDPDPL